MSDNSDDRGVDVELIAAEIETLRDAARRYARDVVDGADPTGSGLDLERAALRYARKLDDARRKASEVDYVAIVEEAERQARRRDDEAN